MIETRYIDLSEKIEKGIKEGLWKERLPGVMRLSRELNAGPATISKAFKLLSEKGLVTIDGRKGTFITQPGKGVKHKVIGVVGISTNTSNYSRELPVMEKTAADKDFRLIGIAHNNDLFINDPNLLLKFPVDGYIFMYSNLTSEIASFLRGNGIPFVSCNNPADIPGVTWVDFDSEAAIAKALNYLIGLGHKKIAYIEFYSRKYKYSERIMETYKKVFAEFGFPCEKGLIVSLDVMDNYSKKYGDDGVRIYGIDAAEMLMKLKNKPTAAIIPHPDMASGFMEKIKQYGLSVPENISIIAYNSRDKTDNFFTTVINDYDKRASEAVKMLMNLMENPFSAAEGILIEAVIQDKRSCKKL